MADMSFFIQEFELEVMHCVILKKKKQLDEERVIHPT